MITATPETWLQTCLDLASNGLSVIDWLTAIDRESELEVIACLVKPGTAECELVSCRMDSTAPSLPSLAGTFPGADWHERETAEMFGVRFDGREGLERLLLRGSVKTPMRKVTPLTARVETSWPGAEPDSGRRRRKLPPGVRAEWISDDE